MGLSLSLSSEKSCSISLLGKKKYDKVILTRCVARCVVRFDPDSDWFKVFKLQLYKGGTKIQDAARNPVRTVEVWMEKKGRGHEHVL